MKPKWIIQFDREFQGLTKGDMDWFKQFIFQLLIEVIEEIPDGLIELSTPLYKSDDGTPTRNIQMLKQHLKSKYVQ